MSRHPPDSAYNPDPQRSIATIEATDFLEKHRDSLSSQDISTFSRPTKLRRARQRHVDDREYTGSFEVEEFSEPSRSRVRDDDVRSHKEYINMKQLAEQNYESAKLSIQRVASAEVRSQILQKQLAEMEAKERQTQSKLAEALRELESLRRESRLSPEHRDLQAYNARLLRDQRVHQRQHESVDQHNSEGEKSGQHPDRDSRIHRRRRQRRDFLFYQEDYDTNLRGIDRRVNNSEAAEITGAGIDAINQARAQVTPQSVHVEAHRSTQPIQELIAEDFVKLTLPESKSQVQMGPSTNDVANDSALLSHVPNTADLRNSSPAYTHPADLQTPPNSRASTLRRRNNLPEQERALTDDTRAQTRLGAQDQRHSHTNNNEEVEKSISVGQFRQRVPHFSLSRLPIAAMDSTEDTFSTGKAIRTPRHQKSSIYQDEINNQISSAALNDQFISTVDDLDFSTAPQLSISSSTELPLRRNSQSSSSLTMHEQSSTRVVPKRAVSEPPSSRSDSDHSCGPVPTSTTLAIASRLLMVDDSVSSIATVCSRILVRAFTVLVREKTVDGIRANGCQRHPARDNRTTRASRSREKRDRDENDDEEEDEHPRKGKARKSVSTPTVVEDTKLLACPFNKYDHTLYGIDSSDQSYRVCSTFSAVGIHHLKQHLLITHRAPEFYCYICCRSDFALEQDLKDHMRELSCIPCNPPKYRDRISTDLAKSLNLIGRNSRGTNAVEYWFTVFDGLFPGVRDSRTITPFYEHGVCQRYLDLFLHFSRNNIGSILESVNRHLPNTSEFDLSRHSPRERIQLDAIQEAVTQFTEHLSTRAMPFLGRPSLLDVARRDDEATATSGFSQSDATTTPSSSNPEQPGSDFQVPQPLGMSSQPVSSQLSHYIQPSQYPGQIRTNDDLGPYSSNASDQSWQDLTESQPLAGPAIQTDMQNMPTEVWGPSDGQAFDDLFLQLTDLDRDGGEPLELWDMSLDSQEIDVSTLVPPQDSLLTMMRSNTVVARHGKMPKRNRVADDRTI